MILPKRGRHDGKENLVMLCKLIAATILALAVIYLTSGLT